MALKSYSSFKKKKKMKKTKDLVTAGVTAILGTALFSETAQAVRRI